LVVAELDADGLGGGGVVYEDSGGDGCCGLDGVYFSYEGGAEVCELGDHLVYGIVCGGVLVGDVDEHELVASCEAGLSLDDCVIEVVVDEKL